MHPLLFQYKFLAVYSYGAMLAIAFLFGISLASRRARKVGLNPNQIVDLCLLILITSIIGARLLYVGQNWDYYQFHRLEIIMIQRGGLVYYGGLIFGFLGALLFIRWKKWRMWQVADILAPSIALGQAFGRIGCFLNGCCFGTLTSLPWGVQFPDKSPAALEFGPLHLVHPTQLYSSLLNFALFLFLLWFDRRRKFEGQTIVVYLLAYGVIRFAIEFLRGDNPSMVAFLTLSQIISLLAIGVALVLMRILRASNATES